ncbi:MAG TPA: hypothetical protein VMR06_00095 [Dokdonella sp.]|uniref:hypothetical protein n=1 Tax=Dokdonella sp. TaxID=2291710 RepID=UPI002C7F0B32|nr:hypothetical protein [Dokdonella sp.]HUD40381.1 hypothetical protein [Dokdonella sp.]
MQPAMNPTIEIGLSFILFLPWFAILGALYWLFPRQPRHLKRKLFDLAVLVLSIVLSIAGMRWGYAIANPASGAIWKQVLAMLVAYGVFLAVLTVAVPLRRWSMRR